MTNSKVKRPYPDLDLIKNLHSKFIGGTVDSLTRGEVCDLVNNQHERICDLERLLGLPTR